VLLTDENGESHISGADLAIALVDEIETPAHRRTRFTVAY
jgi:putative NADH-flavin reductase